jgi:hypothetical protein
LGLFPALGVRAPSGGLFVGRVRDGLRVMGVGGEVTREQKKDTFNPVLKKRGLQSQMF